MADINNCTTRQLMGLPGISRPLAESIIKLRDSKIGIQKVDDLLNLPGMTLSKCRTLARRFALTSRPLLVLGVTNSNRKSYSKITVAHTSFVCQGQSMGAKNINDPDRSERSSHGQTSTQNKSKTELPKKRLQQVREDDQEFPVYPDNSRIPKGPSMLNRNAINLYPTLKPYILQAERACLNRHQGKQGDKPSQAWEPGKSVEPCVSNEVIGSVAEPTQQPSVTLKASASGNNINFSCTIDKRLLPSSGPDQKQQSKKWTLVNAEDVLPTCQPVKKKRPPSEGIGSSKISSDNNDGFDPIININPSYRIKSSSSKTESSESAQVVLHPMLVENMLLFDRQTRMTVREKRGYIEQWVMDVNRAAKDEQPFRRSQKDTESRYSQIHPYYLEVGVSHGNQHYSRRRNRDCGIPHVFAAPAEAAGAKKVNESHRESSVQMKTDSKKSHEAPQRLTNSPELGLHAVSENDGGQREMKVIIENRRILQRRAAKSGNVSRRAASKMKMESVSRPSKSMPEPTKQLKKLVNNYTHPRHKKNGQTSKRPREKEFMKLTR